MPRKSVALFLATTGLLSALAGCSPSQEADEKGGDAMKSAPAGQSAQPQNHTEDKDAKEGNSEEGGEGGEGGEG
jgi:hypothetical protein